MDAMPELDQRMAVEADERDVAADGLVDERLRGRPERLALGEPDEPLELGREVEEDLGVVRRDEVVDEARRPSCPASRPTCSSRYSKMQLYWPVGPADRVLPWRTSVPARFWNSSATCSAMWPTQVPSRSRRDEAAATAQRAGVVLERRKERDQGVGEVRELVRWVLLEDAKVHQHPDDRLARPVVRAPQHAGLDDPQRRRRCARRRWRAPRRPWPRESRRASGGTRVRSGPRIPPRSPASDDGAWPPGRD